MFAGVRQAFKEGSKVQELYKSLGGGLTLEQFLRKLCCPITEVWTFTLAKHLVTAYMTDVVVRTITQSSSPDKIAPDAEDKGHFILMIACRTSCKMP